MNATHLDNTNVYPADKAIPNASASDGDDTIEKVTYAVNVDMPIAETDIIKNVTTRYHVKATLKLKRICPTMLTTKAVKYAIILAITIDGVIRCMYAIPATKWVVAAVIPTMANRCISIKFKICAYFFIIGGTIRLYPPRCNHFYLCFCPK